MRHMDYEKFLSDYADIKDFYKTRQDRKFKDVVYINRGDSVNSPAHYTRGRVEAIEIIEDAIVDAPDPIEGMLQAQVLKYLLRLWVKDNPEEDAKKARWYLDRLITKLDDNT